MLMQAIAQNTIKNKLKLYYSITFHDSFEKHQNIGFKNCPALSEEKKKPSLFLRCTKEY